MQTLPSPFTAHNTHRIIPQPSPVSSSRPIPQAQMSRTLKAIWCTYPALFEDFALSTDLYVKEAEAWCEIGRIVVIVGLVVVILLFILNYFAFVIPVLNQVFAHLEGRADRY